VNDFNAYREMAGYLSENHSYKGMSSRQDVMHILVLRNEGKPISLILILQFSLAGIAFVHPASCDKEVKLRSKINETRYPPSRNLKFQ